MKFKELLVLADIDKTMDFLRKHYYSEMDELKREAQIIGYNKVIATLMTTKPVKKDNENWVLHVSWVHYDEDWLKKFPEDEPYVDVHATNGTLNKESEDYEHWKAHSTEEFNNSETTYAIEFTPWEEWLDFEVSEDSLKEFSYEEILGYCLYEMTFIDWEPEKIKEKSEELGLRCKEAMDNIKEGKGQSFSSVEEMVQHMKDKFAEEDIDDILKEIEDNWEGEEE